MSVRFDAAARRAIDRAVAEAEQRGATAIDSLFLLLGLLAPPTSGARVALTALGLDADIFRGRVAACLGDSDGWTSGHEEPAGAAERVLERAHRISLQCGATEVSDVDVLVACAQDGTTRAGVLLAEAGATAPQLWGVYPMARGLLTGAPADRGAAASGAGGAGGALATPASEPVSADRHRASQRLALARTGIGYDSHRFGPGGPLVLGGVRIEGAQRLVGHSDGDAVAHAVTDAVLGAAGAGDIGEMFSDQDPANHGRDSITMLAAAVARVRAGGYGVYQVDVTVVAEWPRIGPHREAMRSALAEALGIPATSVSVKGKTNEGMGWIGRGEGLACIAVATLAPLGHG